MPTRVAPRAPQGSNSPFIIALILVGVAVGAIFWIGSRQNAVDPAASPGERLYTQYCTACHGKIGEGNLSLEAPALNGDGTIWQFSDGELQRAILTGGEIMPKHEQFLTTTEAAAIVRYIQAWWTEEQLAGQQALSEDDPLQP